MSRLLPLLVLLAACVPDETGYLNDDGIYWSSASDSVSSTTEVVVAGIAGTAAPDHSLILTNSTSGALGENTVVAADGSFVLRVQGQISDELEISYSDVNAFIVDNPDQPSTIDVVLANDIADAAPQPCGGCGPVYSFPDETGYVRPLPENLVSWQPPYILLDATSDAVTLFREGDPGLVATAGDTMCFFGVDDPGVARTAITCAEVPTE